MKTKRKPVIKPYTSDEFSETMLSPEGDVKARQIVADDMARRGYPPEAVEYVRSGGAAQPPAARTA